jgi:opacity protein-like surface antigen
LRGRFIQRKICEKASCVVNVKPGCGVWFDNMQKLQMKTAHRISRTAAHASFKAGPRTAATLVTLLSLLNSALWAQETPPGEVPLPTPAGGSQEDFAAPTAFIPSEGRSRATFSVDYSYVGPGQAKFQGAGLGNSEAQSVNASLAGAVALNEKWFVPLGISSANFFLDSVAGAPIPEEIHTLRLLGGLGYHLNDQWSIAASMGPALYRLSDMDAGTWGVAGMIHALWRLGPDLTLAFGIGFNPDMDVPVLPAAGLRWNIRTNLTLNLMFPRPVLIYRAAPKLSFFAGADIKFAVFRAAEDQGNEIGQTRYNNALGTYRDFHLGAGVEYRIVRGLSLSVEGGYSVGRELDYKRIGQTVTFDPAPYAQAGLKYRF